LILLTSLIIPSVLAEDSYYSVSIVSAGEPLFEAEAVSVFYEPPSLLTAIWIAIATSHFRDFNIYMHQSYYFTWYPSNYLMNAYDMIEEAIDQAHSAGLSFDFLVIYINFPITSGGNLKAGLAKGGSPGDSGVIVTTILPITADFIEMTTQHEISHLYHTPDHSDPSDPHYWEDCVMSYRYSTYYPFYGTTSNWCADCQSIIRSYIDKYGHTFTPSGWGGGGGHHKK
jgi:hypothetical protein